MPTLLAGRVIMSEIELSDESKVIDVLKTMPKPVVLAFLGNLTKSDGTPSASGKMKAVMEALAGDGALNGAEFLIKRFDASGAGSLHPGLDGAND